MPRRPRTAAAGLLIFALAATLAGCSDTTRIPDPTPEATADPLFASDEEALAAAVEVYERYLVEADEALIDPELPLDALEQIASEELVGNITSIRADLESQGLSLTGFRTVTNSEFQSVAPEGDGTAVTFYVCESVEATDLLNADGTSAIGADRNPLSEWQPTVTFGEDGLEAIVTERELWQGGGICDAS